MERRAVNLSFQRSEEYEFGAALLPQEKSEVRLVLRRSDYDSLSEGVG
jgi:hypothetical protein